MPIRPLDDVSDFVVDFLPVALTEEGTRFGTHVATLAAGLSSVGFERYDELTIDQARVACLDLAVLHQACGHRQLAMPDALNLLFSRLARRTGRLPVFLYEDCVLNNPLESDPRLFASGQAGACERRFLQLHQEIETSLERSLSSLDALTHSIEGPRLIVVCETGIREAMDLFAAFHGMPREQFHLFRNYYAAYPGSRHPGVSGRFSEVIHTLRTRIEGRRLLQVIPDYFNEIIEHQQYYPTQGRGRLLDAVERAIMHDETMDRLSAEDPGVHRLVACIRRLMDTISRIHYQLVKKYVS